MKVTRTLATIAALAALATQLPAQQSAGGSNDNTFDWSGEIPSGGWLRIMNLNGSINVEPASGNTAQVHGEKKWREGDPSKVRFVVAKEGDGVTVCALWHEDDSCDENGYHSRGHRDNDDRNDVSVKFTVQLPKGVRVQTSTVNGSLDISGASAEVVAHTVNGRIDAASTSGPVDAATVNGSIRVRMDAIPANTQDLEYSTVNGSVTLEVPSNFSGELEMETVNGSLQSDFPVTMQGRFNPRHLRAKIGEGGPTIHLKTVNGSVELKKLS